MWLVTFRKGNKFGYGRTKMPEGVRVLLEQVGLTTLPLPTLEHRFHGERKWRFDFAWLEKKIAVEVEGGVYSGGRHVRGKGFEDDAIKYNQAQMLGWRVFRYSTGQVKRGLALDDLKKVLE